MDRTWADGRICRTRTGWLFFESSSRSIFLFEHDLRANASRLSRGKTGTHFSGSCSSGANSLSGESELSGGRGDRFARVGANALDHGAQAVGALRRQVLAKSEFVEHRDGVGGKNL